MLGHLSSTSSRLHCSRALQTVPLSFDLPRPSDYPAHSITLGKLLIDSPRGSAGSQHPNLPQPRPGFRLLVTELMTAYQGNRLFACLMLSHCSALLEGFLFSVERKRGSQCEVRSELRCLRNRSVHTSPKLGPTRTDRSTTRLNRSKEISRGSMTHDISTRLTAPLIGMRLGIE